MKLRNILILSSIAAVAILLLSMNFSTNTSQNMQYVLHPADSRGKADYGWLQARYSFSFAQYRNPERMNFGALRVLNNDIVGPERGFNTHHHDNMEIITIPLTGALAHKDDLGNASTIYAGEIQVMSAGSGINHSEFNASATESIELFQIWIFPHTQNVAPRYQQKSLQELAATNALYQILSPNENGQGVWIYQNAWMYMGEFNKNTNSVYSLHNTENGVYCIIIEGSVEIANNTLNKRDAIGIWNTNSFEIQAYAGSKLLIIEVPLL